MRDGFVRLFLAFARLTHPSIGCGRRRHTRILFKGVAQDPLSGPAALPRARGRKATRPRKSRKAGERALRYSIALPGYIHSGGRLRSPGIIAVPSERDFEMGEVARAVLANVVHKLKTVKVGHRITDSGLVKWICGEGLAIADLRYGAQALVFVDDYVGRAMYVWGEHDPRITGVLDAVLSPGDTVLDIGANLGTVALFACKKVGTDGRVHCFEPQPVVAQCLRTSMMINGFTQGIVHECGLSSQSGSAEMAILQAGNLGTATLVSASEPTGAPTIQVRMENAGEFIRALDCRRLSLIKIDVEGHEEVVLGAMRDWMREAKPNIVLFECFVGKDGFWSENVVGLLAGLGYEFLSYDLENYWKTQLHRVGKDVMHPQGHDFVAYLPGGLQGQAAQRLESLIRALR